MAASSHNANPCYTLSSQFPDQVSYPQEANYEASIKFYFYQQARLAPQCIVYPKSTSDVSRIVKIIAGMQAKAAIRGGGHTPFANAANIDNGVTIDLSGMNAVSLGTGTLLASRPSRMTPNFPPVFRRLQLPELSRGCLPPLVTIFLPTIHHSLLQENLKRVLQVFCQLMLEPHGVMYTGSLKKRVLLL